MQAPNIDIMQLEVEQEEEVKCAQKDFSVHVMAANEHMSDNPLAANYDADRRRPVL